MHWKYSFVCRTKDTRLRETTSKRGLKITIDLKSYHLAVAYIARRKVKKHFAFVNLLYYGHLLSLIWSGDYDVSMNKNKGVFFSSTTSTTESSLMRKSEKPGLQFSRQEGGRVNGMRILNHQNRLDDHLSSDVSNTSFFILFLILSLPHPSWIAVSFSSSNRATKGMGSSRGLRRFRKMQNENILSSRFWVWPRRSSWRTGPSGRHPGASNGPEKKFFTIIFLEFYNFHY